MPHRTATAVLAYDAANEIGLGIVIARPASPQGPGPNPFATPPPAAPPPAAESGRAPAQLSCRTLPVLMKTGKLSTTGHVTLDIRGRNPKIQRVACLIWRC